MEGKGAAVAKEDQQADQQRVEKTATIWAPDLSP